MGAGILRAWPLQPPDQGVGASGVDLIFSVVALALLTPVLIFIATATRLSAARREQRFAAMRLVGARLRALPLLGRPGLARLLRACTAARPPRPGQIQALVPGFLLIMIGLVTAGPWPTMTGARIMAGRTSRPGALIAARRLADDRGPRSARSAAWSWPCSSPPWPSRASPPKRRATRLAGSRPPNVLVDDQLASRCPPKASWPQTAARR